jgi:hypothetical protein
MWLGSQFFAQGRTHPREEGKLRVKAAQEPLSFSHEESHWGEYGSAGNSATTIMVPFWQRGQRLRSMPVSLSNKSLPERLGRAGRAGLRRRH